MVPFVQLPPAPMQEEMQVPPPPKKKTVNRGCLKFVGGFIFCFVLIITGIKFYEKVTLRNSPDPLVTVGPFNNLHNGRDGTLVVSIENRSHWVNLLIYECEVSVDAHTTVRYSDWKVLWSSKGAQAFDLEVNSTVIKTSVKLKVGVHPWELPYVPIIRKFKYDCPPLVANKMDNKVDCTFNYT